MERTSRKSSSEVKECSDQPATILDRSRELTEEYYEQLVREYGTGKLSERSAYEEVEIVKNCTLFDVYRKPRRPITDKEAKKTLYVRDLNSNLTCPVCLSLIKQTTVVMECLHRFCGECIQKCLRMGMRECPSCRIHIPSKRSLRRDTNFDALISAIYPNRDQFEQEEANMIEEINRKRHFNNAFCAEKSKDTQSQTNVKRTRVRGSTRPSRKQDVEPQNHCIRSASSENSASDERLAHDEVNLNIVLHPKEEQHADKKLTKTLFRTSSRLKIRNLKQSLLRLLHISPESPEYSSIRIVVPAENTGLSCRRSSRRTVNSKSNASTEAQLSDNHSLEQELSDHFTLAEIYQQYAKGTDWEMKLWYHFPSTEPDHCKPYYTRSSKRRR